MNQSSSNRVDVWLDDIVIADDLDAQNDDFLSDLRIGTLVSAAGTSVQEGALPPPPSGRRRTLMIAMT